MVKKKYNLDLGIRLGCLRFLSIASSWKRADAFVHHVHLLSTGGASASGGDNRMSKWRQCSLWQRKVDA